MGMRRNPLFVTLVIGLALASLFAEEGNPRPKKGGSPHKKRSIPRTKLLGSS